MFGFAFENATLLSAAGIAWDISGGIALSKGLILDDDTLKRRAGSYWGSSPPAIRGLCEQRIDAKFGLGQLLFGFALQLLSAVGLSASPIAAITAALPIAAAWWIYRYNFDYFVTVASLRHAAPDSSESVWRGHFSDVSDMIWFRAVVQTGAVFKPPTK